MNSDDDKTRIYVALTKDTMVSHYRIVEKIGAGGMGEVYLAEDTELDRQVALKFLPTHQCLDSDSRTRFTREAKAAAKLDHPNIVPIHEVGEFNERPFFAMAYIEGQSLKEVITQGKLSSVEAVDYANQICEGLHEAHSAGVVHRDVKPANIIIDRKNTARILDFGLATVPGEEKLTKTGSTLGTIGYMAPEQIEGKQVDHRSDLFSVGVILYEMLTGRRPFEGENDVAIIRAITGATPEPIARFKSGVPVELQQVADKALAKDPALRYQHADGMLPDLMRVKQSMESGQSQLTGRVDTRRSARRWSVAAALMVVVAAIVLFATQPWTTNSTSDQPEKIRLVVLPFENLGAPEDEYFADGITDEITSLISEISDIGVISRTSAYAFKDSAMTVAQIGEALDVQYVLEGTIRWDRTNEPGQVRIIPQLIDTRHDEHLWSDRFERDFVNIFAIQAEIAEQIVGELGKSLSSKSPHTIASERATNPEAYRYYLRGLGHRKNNEFAAAREMFTRAIELDSTFVKGYAFLSSTISMQYSWPFADREPEDGELAKRLAERAIEIQPDVVDAIRAMGQYYQLVEFDHEKALDWYQQALEQDPEDATTHWSLADLEQNFANFEKAYTHIQHAIALDPANSDLLWQLGTICHSMRKYDEAITAFEDLLIHNPKNQFAWGRLAFCESQRSGSISRIGSVVERAYEELPDFWDLSILFPDTYDLMTGNESRILERRENLGVTSYNNDKAFYFLDRTYALYYAGSINEARIYADSLRVWYLDKIDRQANTIELKSAKGAFPSIELAMAYAVLGDSSQTRTIVDKILLTDPLVKDGHSGHWVANYCVELLTMIGAHGRAIDLLEEMLVAPTGFSAAGLAINPYVVPLRNHPRFQALIKKYENKHEQ